MTALEMDEMRIVIDLLADAIIRVITETREPANTDGTISFKRRPRRTKAQIAADEAAEAGDMPPMEPTIVAPAPAPAPTPAPTPVKAAVAAPVAPAAPPAPPAAASVDYTALRAGLIAAVRASLVVNGEDETITRLGYANISSVPNEELASVTARVSA